MSLSDFQCFSSQKLSNPDGMNWRGTWGIPGVYQYGDVIEYNGESYVCIDLDGTVGSLPDITPAAWQLLSDGSATAVSITAANGSGITVAEPTPNNFTVATNLTAAPGSGISLTPSGLNTSIAVANTGVLSVSAGTGISIGGTAQNPSVAVSFPTTTRIVDNVLSPGVLSATTPVGGADTSITTFPVVAGGVYQVTAALSMFSTQTNANAVMSIGLSPSAPVGGLPPGPYYELFTVQEVNAGRSVCASVTYTAPPGATQSGIFITSINALGAIQGTISSLYVTRIA